MTDFNVAAYLPEDGGLLTSFAGTVSYMAPEVLKRSGYREEADWWSVAVVAFELLFGKRPFRASSGKEVMFKIVHSQYTFPSMSSREISEECIDFITQCLDRDPVKRLGCSTGGGKFRSTAEAIKAHPWFDNLDWRAMECQGVSPPFTPNLKAGNFSAVFEAEDILLEDKPLKSNRKSRAVESLTDPGLIRIRDEFPDYDFTREVSEEKKRQRVVDVRKKSRHLEEEASTVEVEEQDLDKHDDQEEAAEGTQEEDDDDIDEEEN